MASPGPIWSVVDAAASYDRGLAYAMRVRIGAEVPGDLGRAAQGFEEARELSREDRVHTYAGFHICDVPA